MAGKGEDAKTIFGGDAPLGVGPPEAVRVGIPLRMAGGDALRQPEQFRLLKPVQALQAAHPDNPGDAQPEEQHPRKPQQDQDGLASAPPGG